jgi:hypothetical protein
METTRRGGFEPILVGGGGLGLGLLATLGAVVTGLLPWPALPAVWLGGNAAFVFLLSTRPAPATETRRDGTLDAPVTPPLPR